MAAGFESIFARLRGILQKHAATLYVKEDKTGSYILETEFHPKLKKRLWFGAVRIGKAYVSYHLMPVYGHPPLLDGMSKKLKARMQGKACFNFKTEDEALFKELEDLTARGFTAFKKAGYI